MSRIHEALKKAQEERAVGQVEASPADTILAPPPVAPHVLPQPAPAAEPDVLTFEALASRCRHADWIPEPKTALLLDSRNHTHGSEELRTLRSRLYQIRDRQPLKKVLITSALPAEGKTFLTANLGQMIVRQHERRCLMIDADLRRSQLHQPLGAAATPGLTDYLKGEADEFAILQRGKQENLFLIPGGKPVANPMELVANGRVQALLARLEPLFDWILIDSPPAVPVSDATMLADLCDGVLLVVRSAKTPFDMAQKARDEFQNKRLLGVVLNRVEPGQTYHSYYYHYYGRGSENKKSKK